mmetsp:Transcript_25324/g.59275  ORF Transcript_25324/g.59275 Transcript_25324/m.59275 type:complete len:879 (-) Transcript_25324:2979-5615(-)
MAKNEGDGGPRGGNWIRRTMSSFFVMNDSSSVTKWFGILLLSLKEDSPIWIGSMWIIWKQQPPKSMSVSADNRLTPALDCTVIGHMGSAFSGFWKSIPLDLVVDAIVLGTLLIYKKSYEEACRKSFDRRGNHDDNEEKVKTTGNAEEANCDARNTTRDSVDELKKVLNEHSIGSSQLLSSTLKRAMPSPFVSDLHQLTQQQSSRETIEAPSAVPSENSNHEKRYVELLVHNVSHTDLVLSLDAPLPTLSCPLSGRDGSDSFCLCRPRFSAFDAYSQRLMNFIQGKDEQKILESAIRLPRYERNDETQQPQPSSHDVGEEVPIGFRLQHGHKAEECLNLNSLQISSDDLKDLRVRGRDAHRVTNYSSSSADDSLKINAVFFPLLATLMPLWVSKISTKYGGSSSSSTTSPLITPKKVLILVSGVGQPRNWTHSVKGNSTRNCAELMKIFLQSNYPDLIVVHIHSDTNIFRYDENITFVQNELLPKIQEYRDAHAQGLPYPDEVSNISPYRIDRGNKNRPFSTEWRKSFSVTISYADGSPARNHAIQAALRTFKPMYYHFWQLKTFWHESKIVSSDIEVHSFEEMETLPPVETDQLQDRPLVKQVVDEMKRFRSDFTKILSNSSKGSNDIQAFWLRKTLKPVIAVLAVQTPSGQVKLYRGTNMEVSMPTGSLCAERNVIGTALADNPSLKRQDLKMIAVLAIPNPKQMEHSTKSLERQRVRSLNSIATLATATSEDEGSTGKHPLISSRKSSLGEEEDWTVQTPSSFPGNQQQNITNLDKNASLVGSTNLEMFHHSNISFDSTQPPNPTRTIYLYNKPQHQTRRLRRAVVVHSNQDMNPLRPCGACNEWLKKLAESNPYFTILTFTDSACNGVYCTPCEE